MAPGLALWFSADGVNQLEAIEIEPLDAMAEIKEAEIKEAEIKEASLAQDQDHLDKIVSIITAQVANIRNWSDPARVAARLAAAQVPAGGPQVPAGGPFIPVCRACRRALKNFKSNRGLRRSIKRTQHANPNPQRPE